jgi:beta-lactamase class A
MNIWSRLGKLLAAAVLVVHCSWGGVGTDTMSRSTIEFAIDTLLAGRQGVYALAYKNMQTGETICRREKAVFHAASTMKTPVMIEVFTQAAAGKMSLDDSVDVVNSFHSIVDGSEFALDLASDSDDHLYTQIGKTASVRSLLTAMITVSSNLATNLLIEKVGAPNVLATMRSLGANDIQVLRGVEDNKAFRLGLNNTTTAYDLMLIYEHIAAGTIVSRDACDAMTEVLRRQQFNDMIPALLPRDVVVAHKTGSITGVQHDSGIVTLPDGRRYVLVVLSKDLPSAKEGIETIASLSKLLYDYTIETIGGK